MSKEISSPKFWLSLEQKENPKYDHGGEFSSTPVREGYEKEGLDRRDFMKLMGASALMASFAGCSRRPIHKIVPYVNAPEEIIPGVPNFYASADPLTGYGFIVRTREGRPVKVDGNTDHPMNKGSLSARGQALVHDLYDPDRLRVPKIDGQDVTWENFDKAVKDAVSKGSVAFVTASVLSPTVKGLINKYNAKHVSVDALSMDDVLDGQAESYGARVFPRYRFDKADYIVSIDADFLGTWGSAIEYTKQFAEKRRLLGKKISMSKLVVFESAMRLTGQNADERYVIAPSDQLNVALGIASEVARLSGRSASELSGYSASAVAQKTGLKAEVIAAVAKDLVRNKGRSLFLAGAASGSSASAVALQNVVNFVNSTLGNEGETVDAQIAPSYQYQGSFKALAALVREMNAGQIKTLVIQGFNPLYSLPASFGFEAAMAKVPNVVYVGSYLDETALKSKFVAAESHSFEAWGDVNPQKDLYSIVQPTIQSLWQTKSFLEMLLGWSGSTVSGYDAVRATWKDLHKKYGVSQAFEGWWEDMLMGGVFHPGSKSYEGKASARSFKMEALKSALAAAKAGKSEEGFTLLLLPSIAMGDGFQANNVGLQELPDPVAKTTWGNYLMVSPATAKKNGWDDGDFLKVEVNGMSVAMQVQRQPGVKEGVLAAYLGYGRKFNGRNGNNVGVRLVDFAVDSAGQLAYAVSGAKVSRTGASAPVPITQHHHSMEGRDIVFDTTLEEYRENPSAGIERHGEGVPASIWSEHQYPGYKWGMVIDMNACTGCSACVIACNVENNVPAVGKDQVLKAREMQWIRIDRYYSGDEENPETTYQTMLCQHCDNAPCETVCPVLATTHSSEGLNQMTYNRCVGTKYCSNNCPYKVRRFNWFNNNGDMNAPMEHPLALSKNPEVTLRSRGVMEKCTFCVQRIEAGKSQAKSEGRKVNDNDIRTACQEACPADAISFGDTNNKESSVAKLKEHPRGFVSLEDVNARPAITYLSKVRNRAPMKESKLGEKGHGEGHRS